MQQQPLVLFKLKWEAAVEVLGARQELLQERGAAPSCRSFIFPPCLAFLEQFLLFQSGQAVLNSC